MKKFNYNTIYNNYKNNLLNKLRAFGDGDDLSLWVANENISVSVLNLIDALELDRFQIEFDDKSFNSIDREFLKKKLIGEGNLIFETQQKLITFSRLSKTSKISVPKVNRKINTNNYKTEKKVSEKINLIKDEYLKNLNQITINQSNEIKNKPSSPLLKLEYKDKKCELILSINSNNHQIVECNFLLIEKNDIILNKFGNFVSQEILNLPINEAKDHLLIKIESKLRPEEISKKRGIILKNSAGKIFSYFQQIIDNLYLEYIKKTKTNFGINFFDNEIPDKWISTTNEFKKKEIEKNLDQFNKINCKSSPLKLVEIVQSNRLFFSLDELSLNKFDNAFFIKLEKFLSSRICVKFEVYYVNRKDENTLRSV